jgi:polysaccharide export outer membrane protein
MGKNNVIQKMIWILVLYFTMVQPSGYADESKDAQTSAVIKPATIEPAGDYMVGPDDIIEINVLRPEPLASLVTVSPDSFISFAYIGNVSIKGMTLSQVQDEVAKRLSDGFMKYPVVSVALRESRSKKFYVYGEVMKPGPYPMEENITAFRAIALAGGFTKFGGSSRVKVLRPKAGSSNYETIKIDVKAVNSGSNEKDIKLKAQDIVVVSEGII